MLWISRIGRMFSIEAMTQSKVTEKVSFTSIPCPVLAEAEKGPTVEVIYH